MLSIITDAKPPKINLYHYSIVLSSIQKKKKDFLSLLFLGNAPKIFLKWIFCLKKIHPH